MMIHHVVKETNDYAVSPRVAKDVRTTKNRHMKLWTPLVASELLAFIGIVIYMGVVKLPSRDMYWDTRRALGVQAIKNCMTRDRFSMIARCLHFERYDPNAPKRGEDGYDKIICIRRVLEMFRSACMSNWRLGQCVAVDEAMIKMKGLSPLRTYMPNKPVKYGYKVWCLCCSTTGYLYNFDVYQGKVTKETEVGLGKSVVVRLMSVLYRGCVVACDRFFNSIALCYELLKHGMFVIGTIMTNRRGLPSGFAISKGAAQKTLTRGTWATWTRSTEHGDITATRWMDNKPVYFLGTYGTGTTPTTLPRMDKGGSTTHGTRIDVPCPDMVAHYQGTMGGVDTFDHLRAAYTCRLKMKGKWYHYLFWWVVESAIVNAYVLYKHNPFLKTISHAHFRLQLALVLMSKCAVSSGRAGTFEKEHPTRLTHKPTLYDLKDPSLTAVPRRNSGTAKEKHNCVVCRAAGITSVTSYVCKICDVYMHPGYCSEHFHSVADWRKHVKADKIFNARSQKMLETCKKRKK